MAFKLTMEEINEYKAAFSLFDKESQGRISTDDVVFLMRSLGQNFSNAEFDSIFSHLDNTSGFVEFHEFLELMAKYRKTNENQDKLIKAFKYFDRTNSGTIDFKELIHVLSVVAENLSESEIEALKKISQVDENNRLNYFELLKLMTTK